MHFQSTRLDRRPTPRIGQPSLFIPPPSILGALLVLSFLGDRFSFYSDTFRGEITLWGPRPEG